MNCYECLLGIYEVSTRGRRIIAVTLSCILSIARISRGGERPSNLASIIICPNLDSASARVRATRLPSTRLLLKSSPHNPDYLHNTIDPSDDQVSCIKLTLVYSKGQ